MMKPRKELMERRPEVERRMPEWTNFDDMLRRLKWDVESFLTPWEETRLPIRRFMDRDYIAVDMKDEGDHYDVEASLPGINKENVELEINNDRLTISAKGTEEKEETEEGYVMKERSSYSSTRTIRIPEEVFEDRAKANMKDGVLHLYLPKKEPTPKKQTRKIKIE
jgi:HSP20 family protein